MTDSYAEARKTHRTASLNHTSVRKDALTTDTSKTKDLTRRQVSQTYHRDIDASAMQRHY